MEIDNLFHIAIKTHDLDATIRFYVDVLGMHQIERPDFGYPGAWLATPGGASIFHIYAGRTAIGAPYGSGAIDHVSITATGFHQFVERFKQHGLDWREFRIAKPPLWQLFVYDPSGVQLEITFFSDKETGPEPDVLNRGYKAGTSFFKAPTPSAT